jgi:hypothetical protein
MVVNQNRLGRSSHAYFKVLSEMPEGTAENLEKLRDSLFPAGRIRARSTKHSSLGLVWPTLQ